VRLSRQASWAQARARGSGGQLRRERNDEETDAMTQSAGGQRRLLGHELEALSSEEIKQRFEAEQRA